MHKRGNAVIGVIVLVVLLVAGGAFVYSQQAGLFDDASQATGSPTTTAQSDNYHSTSSSGKDESNQQDNLSTGTAQSNIANGSEMSSSQEISFFKQAFRGSASARCSVDTRMGPAESLTIYIDSGKARIETVFPDRSTGFAIVGSGGSVMWREGSQTGRSTDSNRVRQILSGFVDYEGHETISEQHPVAEKKELKSIFEVVGTSIVECQKASIDKGMFELPEGVNFSG